MLRLINYTLLTILLAVPIYSQHTPDALLMRFPDVSQDKIVFVYSGDLWTVDREGGTAVKISSPDGDESWPKFSPDGSLIAFSGNYDGNTDVYVIPSQGGVPKRMTYHGGADALVEWYPEGKSLLFRTRRTTITRRVGELYKVSVEGGMPEKLPLEYGYFASFNSDASKMAFQTHQREFRTWKRYRGGMATDIWIYDFAAKTAENVTDFVSNDGLPMWHNNTIYFVSDRDENKKSNIWALDAATKEVRQVTSFTEYDVKFPSVGPDAIVFENGGKLHLLDLATETTKPVEVTVPSDLPLIRTEQKDVSSMIQSFWLSPKGERALFEARGDIYTVPAEHGVTLNLTNTSGVAERSPNWSPDGKWVAYLSDRTGEYEIYIRPADGSGEEKQITSNGKGFRMNLHWSPDSKKLSFVDKTGSVYLVDVDEGTPKLIYKDPYTYFITVTWSADSRYIAYTGNTHIAVYSIFIYDTETEQNHRITTDFYSASNPAFDPEGKYLYFSSDREFNPIYSNFDVTWIYANSGKLYAVTLQSDVESPMAPRNDVVEVTEEEAAENDEENETDSEETNEEETLSIEFEGIFDRVVELPMDAGNYGGLIAVEGKLLYLERPRTGAGNGNTSTLKYYDFKERESKDVISGISNYDISPSGNKIIYSAGGSYGVIDIAPNKKVGDGKLDLSGMKTFVDPREEWTQIFNEAWRIERDFFYDPDMHGVDWQQMKERYSKLLPFIVNRNDLNYILGEMIGELNVSHSYVFGGDINQPETIGVGYLGCDFMVENGYFKIAEIIDPGNWNDFSLRSPLSEPGVNISAGDYLIAVNKKPLDTSLPPYAAFQGLDGKVITITVNDQPSPEGARDVVIKTLSSESNLRHFAWVEHNRKYVEEQTDGKVGYIYVPNTGRQGQNELFRQFMGQASKDALIIDERFNGGGQIPDRFVELLGRKTINYWARQDFESFATPYVTHNGPKVMLINGWAGSGGDAFPYYFKKQGIGPLIGKRTWGGLVGISSVVPFVDGGAVTAPSFGFYTLEKGWEIENHGVDPDYEVENPPNLLYQGVDMQLDKSIEVIKELLKTNPPPEITKPEYPDRSF